MPIHINQNCFSLLFVFQINARILFDIDRPWALIKGFLKEYVASIIGLYKNNGAVSCVAINFLFMEFRKVVLHLDTQLNSI